jgi:YggT family protein
VPSVVAQVLYYALLFFYICMIVRLIMGWVFMLTRYRATGVVAMVLEVVYSVTDPPIKALQRVLPPLRIGNFSLDLGFIVLIIGVQILMGIVKNQI